MDRIKILSAKLELGENDSDLDYYLFRVKPILEQLINCVDTLEYCAADSSGDSASAEESLARLDDVLNES